MICKEAKEQSSHWKGDGHERINTESPDYLVGEKINVSGFSRIFDLLGTKVIEEGEWGWYRTIVDPTGAMIYLFQQRRKRV